MTARPHNQTCKPILLPCHTSSSLCLHSTCVHERFSFCLRAVERRTHPEPQSECNVAHSTRLFFQPFVGSLPSARHCSQVCGFLKSNLPFDEFGRNCVRGKARSQAWQVIGLAAASMDLCCFNAKKPESLSFFGVGQHSLHLIFASDLMR